VRARVIALGAAAVVFVALGLTASAIATHAFSGGWDGPTSVLEEDLIAWQQERAIYLLLNDAAGPLITAGLYCLVGAVLVLAIAHLLRERAQRASASATAS
jgi:hypothetical protein